LPGFTDAAGDGDEAAAPSAAGAPSPRAAQIAEVAAARASLDVDPTAPVRLGAVTAPSGTLAIFDVALMGYLPRAALDPLMICIDAPRDRPLAVIGTRVGKGRFADCWDHVAIELSAGDVARSRKLGEAAVDFARLLVIDRAAIDAWQHEDSLDQLADFVFWGRDEAALAKATGARRLPEGHHGWHDLPLADAEARADRAAALKAEHGWQLASELRPHSHHFAALAAAREVGAGAGPIGAGSIDVAGARVLLFFTSWGNGVFPVFLDLDSDGRPARVRIQLAPAELASGGA
jgi:hypothetical protein